MPTYSVLIRANANIGILDPRKCFHYIMGLLSDHLVSVRGWSRVRGYYSSSTRELWPAQRGWDKAQGQAIRALWRDKNPQFSNPFLLNQHHSVYSIWANLTWSKWWWDGVTFFFQKPSAMFTWSILCHLVASSLSRLSREKYRTWKFDCQKCYVIMIMKNRKMQKAADRKSRRTRTSSAHRQLSGEFQYVKMDRDTYTDPWRRGESVKGTSSPHRIVRKEDFLLPPALIWTSHLTLWLNTQRSAFLASSVYYSVMNTVFVKDPEIEIL